MTDRYGTPSRPDDIPEAVWNSCWWAQAYGLQEAASRQIMAAKAEEREACATLAFAFNEDVPEHFSAMPFSLDAAAGWVSARIAAAIRKRGEAD